MASNYIKSENIDMDDLDMFDLGTNETKGKKVGN